jgi:hypothetical protein
MIRGLRSRGVFAVACELTETRLLCGIFIPDPEDYQPGPRELVDVDTGDRYSVLLPTLLKTAYNLELTRYASPVPQLNPARNC